MTFTKEQKIAAAQSRIWLAEMMLEGELEPLKERSWAIELELARIALASLEAEPVMYASKETLAYAKDGEQLLRTLSSPSGDCVIPLYSAPPAPVSVPDELLSAMEEVLRISDRDHDAWHKVKAGIVSCRAAMLQGAAGNSPAIPDSYDIESFGIFRASEGRNGFIVEIDQFRFGTEKCPKIGKTHMVPKFALQAIINALQRHCDSMEEAPSLAEEVNREVK